MYILNKSIKLKDLINVENDVYFDDIVKGVVDIKQGLLALNAELHSDLEEYLLQNGSEQSSLYGINIILDSGEIEYDSLINPPRNRADGYPRAGREVADPKVRDRIKEIVERWIIQ